MEDKKTTKNIEVGNFYLIHDGSKTGHPGLVVWKDDLANLYLLIKFGSTKNDDNKTFPYKISNAKTNYIYKRPFLAKRKDIGKEWRFDFELSSEANIIVLEIKNNLPVCSKNINRKDRRFFSLVVKKEK